MNGRQTRVLGIDASLRSTGYGVVTACGNALSVAEYGILKNSPKAPHSECLQRLHEGIVELIGRAQPGVVAIEGAFFCENARTAMILGEARGAIISACAVKGLPIYEYAPRKVKQAVVGTGAASKEQVCRMVMRILNLAETPQEDAADALGIAICHLHNRTSVAQMAPKTI